MAIESLGVLPIIDGIPNLHRKIRSTRDYDRQGWQNKWKRKLVNQSHSQASKNDFTEKTHPNSFLDYRNPNPSQLSYDLSESYLDFHLPNPKPWLWNPHLLKLLDCTWDGKPRSWLAFYDHSKYVSEELEVANLLEMQTASKLEPPKALLLIGLSSVQNHSPGKRRNRGKIRVVLIRFRAREMGDLKVQRLAQNSVTSGIYWGFDFDFRGAEQLKAMFELRSKTI